MALSVPQGNFTIHQLKNLKVGDMGFSALCTYFNKKVWGNTIYGSKEEFEKVFISFVVTHVDSKKGEFRLRFDALPEGENIQRYSLKKVLKDKQIMKYYFFCADASVLPQGHSVIHSVPDDEVILLPVPKKSKKRADPPENSACNHTTQPINLSDSEPGPYKSHLNVADSPTFPAALPSSSVHSSTTQECVVSESLDRVHVNVTVPTDEELNWTETQQNEDVQICAFVPDATPVQEPLTSKFQHPFSTSIRQSRQIVPNVNSNEMPPPMFAHQTNTSSHSIGERVAVVWTVGVADEWFPGTVVEIENGKYKVRCDDGDVTAFRNASELVALNDAPGSNMKTPVCLDLFKSPDPKVVAQSPKENVRAQPMKKQKRAKVSTNQQTNPHEGKTLSEFMVHHILLSNSQDGRACVLGKKCIKLKNLNNARGLSNHNPLSKTISATSYCKGCTDLAGKKVCMHEFCYFVKHGLVKLEDEFM